VPARLTAEQKRLREITEASWQSTVVALAKARGWTVYAPPPNRPANGHIINTRAGYPDLTMVRDGRILWAELKKETGKLTAEQVAWLDLLLLAGAEVAVWRPSDLETVQAVLA
jgi:hypothetical protein